jgi:tetratricopeptide (TPR) repeat protein
MGENFQVWRAAVNVAKGIRQFQEADNEIDKDNLNSAVRHLGTGLNRFTTALDHLEKAEDDAAHAAAKELTKGNDEVRKCVDAYGKDDPNGASKHYEKALEHYDSVLDKLDV